MSVWRPNEEILLTDSEDDEDGLKKDYKGREAVLFVIDANLYENQERFFAALKIVRDAFISGLLVNDKDLLGLVFANTEMSPEPLEVGCLDDICVPENCAVFIPLRQLSKPIVEHYLRFLETAPTDFGKLYGTVDGGCGKFAAMIRLCLNLFDNCGYSLNNASLVYMTDRETPHAPQSHEFLIALQKAKDLEGKEVEFKVIPMVDEFDYSVFYKEFICLARDTELASFVPQEPQQLRLILSDRKLRQDFLKRSLGHFKFSLGPGLEISTLYYNYFKRRCLPRKVKLLRKNNTIVQQKRTIIVRKENMETQEIVEEREVKCNAGWYEIDLGGRAIRITPEQINRVRNFHQPGMMLLGFKPKSSLPSNLYYKPANFMYPDEAHIHGSKRLFTALWQRCLEREKIAMCLFMRKRKSIPRYVALVPVSSDDKDSKDLDALLTGDGFKIVYLPMEKHIRNIDFTNWNTVKSTAPEEGIEVFQKILKKLRTNYEPNLFNDPTLETLQSNLLALALNIKTDGDNSNGMPDTAMQDARIEKYLPEFNEIFGAEEESVAKKRTAKEPAEERAAKISKPTEENLKSYDFVEQLVADKKLDSCTVSQLRGILDEHFGIKLPAKTIKQDLMSRIYDESK